MAKWTGSSRGDSRDRQWQIVHASSIGSFRRDVAMNVRTSRSGFTLLEVLAALTITALVTTVAGSALRAGIDVRDRIGQNRETVEAESRVRSWLTDMIRHPASASSVDGAIFQMTQRVNADNVPIDALSLMSIGVEPPYGASAQWRVTLNVEADGLHVRATPTARENTRASIETVLPHIAGLRIEALETGGINSQPAWRNDWPLQRVMPAAIRFTFVARDGSPISPLVVVTSPIAGGAQ